MLGAALGGAAILLVAAVVAGGIAVVRGQEAAVSAEDARTEALVATSLALRPSDRELAALLAAEAYRRWPDDARVRSALFGTMIAARGLVDTHRLADATRSAMAVIPGTGTALRVAEVGRRHDDRDRGSLERDRRAELRRGSAADPAQFGRNLSVSRDGTVAAIQTGRLVDTEDTASCCWNQLTFIDLASGEVLPGSQLLKMRTSDVIDLGEDGSVAYLQHPITRRSHRCRHPHRRGPRFRPEPPSTTTPESRAGRTRVARRRRRAGGDEHVRRPHRRLRPPNSRRSRARSRSVTISRPLFLVADGAGGVLVGRAAELLRVRIDTGVVEWRRPLDASEGCYRLLVTPRATIACSSYVGVTEFELATGMPTEKAIELQLDSVADIGVLDDATLLISSTFNSFWMRWRIDGSGAGVSRGRRTESVVTDGPDRDGASVSAQPVAGGPAQLWNLECRRADRHRGRQPGCSSAEASWIGGTRASGIDSRTPQPGSVYPYRIPGLPEEFDRDPRRAGPAGVRPRSRTGSWPFDPATGEAVGEPMSVPGWRVDVGALRERDSRRGPTSRSRGGMSERRLARRPSSISRPENSSCARASGVDETLVIGPDELIAVTDETAQRVALDTLEPRSSLPRATGGSQALDVSLDGRTLLNVGLEQPADALRPHSRHRRSGRRSTRAARACAADTSPPTARR